MRRTTKHSWFTEKQITGTLKQHEAGTKTADVFRKHGISEATFCKYKARFGGMKVSNGRRLRVLENENAKIRKLLAEQLDNAVLKDVAARKWRCSPRRVLQLLMLVSEPRGVFHSRFRPLLGALSQPQGGLSSFALKDTRTARALESACDFLSCALRS